MQYLTEWEEQDVYVFLVYTSDENGKRSARLQPANY
jgi:hypothetical protein